MINDAIKRDKKLKELLEITNISDEEFEKLDFKGKQRYFKAKNKLCKVFFVSKDKKGNGITYKKSLQEVKKK
jgi:hypothetical protein